MIWKLSWEGLKQRVNRGWRLAGISLGAAVLLAGCQSENPMDYLPKVSGGYMGMNATSFRESAGLKRLNDTMGKLQPGAQNLQSEKARSMIMGFDTPVNPRTAPPVYGVALGDAGFADELVAQYKSAGAQQGRMAGHTTYTSGPVSIAPIGKTGVLIFQSESSLERMVNVSKKKEEGARGSASFNWVNSELPNHAVVMAGAAQPLTEMGGPLLTTLNATDPKAGEALRHATMISLTFDWKDHPVVDLKLHVPSKSDAEALARTANQYLQLAKGLPVLEASPAFKAVLQPLKAHAEEDGVELTVNVPADVADQVFSHLEAGAAMQGQQQ